MPDAPFNPFRVRRRLWAGGIAVGLCVLAVIGLNVTSGMRSGDTRLALGHDLMPSYVAGAFIRMGEPLKMYSISDTRKMEEQVRKDANLAPPTGTGGAEGFGPWLNPPFFAWAFVPLSALPYRTAAAVFLGINILLLAGAIALLTRSLRTPVIPGPTIVRPVACGLDRIRTSAHLRLRAARWGGIRNHINFSRWGLVPLLIMSCMPFWQAMCHQQNTFISLLLLSAAVTFWRVERGLWAGYCIGLLFFKPQLAAILAVVLVLDLGWPAFIGLAMTGSTLLIVNLLTLPGTIHAYLHTLPGTLHWLQTILPYNWGRQVTFQSFWRLLIQGQVHGETQLPAMICWWVSSAVVGGMLVSVVVHFRENRRPKLRDRMIAATIAAMPLIMPYYMDYDLLLLSVAAVLTASDWMSRSTDRSSATEKWLFAAWIALFWVTQINPGLAGNTRLNLGVPTLLMVFTCAAIRVWKNDEATRQIQIDSGSRPVGMAA